MTTISAKPQNTWVKPVTEWGPLMMFFGAYWIWGVLPATAVLMAATLAAVVLSLVVMRKLPLLAVITAVVVGVFGGLTLWLQSDIWIKMKPTIVQAIIAIILLGGLFFRKALLKPVMGAAWPMDDDGWRKLTFRFALFFAAMAVLNEIVWRTQSTDLWVTFKVFGIMGLTFVFMMTQIPLLKAHAAELPDES